LIRHFFPQADAQICGLKRQWFDMQELCSILYTKMTSS